MEDHKVKDFIYQKQTPQREIMLYLHDLLTIEFGLTEKIKYNIPFYYNKSWICYLNPTKNNTIELAFIRGNELSDNQGILSSKERKQVHSIEFKNISKIPVQEINEIIQEALFLDETAPYKLKNK